MCHLPVSACDTINPQRHFETAQCLGYIYEKKQTSRYAFWHCYHIKVYPALWRPLWLGGDWEVGCEWVRGGVRLKGRDLFYHLVFVWGLACMIDCRSCSEEVFLLCEAPSSSLVFVFEALCVSAPKLPHAWRSMIVQLPLMARYPQVFMLSAMAYEACLCHSKLQHK